MSQPPSDVSYTSVHQSTMERGSPGQKVPTGANRQLDTFEFNEGDIVYHKNPIGLNYVFRGKQGTITGFVNTTKKRAVVTWSTGDVKKHNISSLSRSQFKESSTPSKKRKRGGGGPTPKKSKIEKSKIERQNSLQSDYIDSADTLLDGRQLSLGETDTMLKAESHGSDNDSDNEVGWGGRQLSLGETDTMLKAESHGSDSDSDNEAGMGDWFEALLSEINDNNPSVNV